MPGIGTPIVIGGGIQLASPNALNEGLFLSSITPPAAFTSPRWRISGSALIAESAAGKTNLVIGIGTTSTATVNEPEILIGHTVTSALASSPGANVGIGVNIGFTAAATFNTIIGNMTAGLFPVGGTTGGGLTIVGRVNSLGGAFRNDSTAVGSQTTIAGSNCVVIGKSASATGNQSVVIGETASSSVTQNTVIGQAAGAAGARTIVIGQAATGTGTTTDLIAIGNNIGVANLNTMIVIGGGATVTGVSAGTIIMGHNNNGGGGFSTALLLGGANLHTAATAVPAWTNRYKNAQGTDVAAGSVTFIAPLATGNAAGGSFIFQTGPAGASGATLQTATTRLTLSPNGVLTSASPTAAAENLVIDGFGGANQASIRLNNLTNGAGAAAGTLNNSPAAGDPTFWIPISIAGVVKFIPAW